MLHRPPTWPIAEIHSGPHTSFAITALELFPAMDMLSCHVTVLYVLRCVICFDQSAKDVIWCSHVGSNLCHGLEEKKTCLVVTSKSHQVINSKECSSKTVGEEMKKKKKKPRWLHNLTIPSWNQRYWTKYIFFQSPLSDFNVCTFKKSTLSLKGFVRY